MILLILLISIPIIEIAAFVQVGGMIGVWNTIFLTIATAMAGSALLKTQGISALSRAQKKIDSKKVPMEEMFDGICLFTAGILLLIPGFVTDSIGLLLFIPPIRSLIFQILKESQIEMFTSGMVGGNFFRYNMTEKTSHSYKDSSIIEGEFKEIKNTDDKIDKK